MKRQPLYIPWQQNCDFFTISKFVFAKMCPPLPTLHKVPYLAPCPFHFLAGTLTKMFLNSPLHEFQINLTENNYIMSSPKFVSSCWSIFKDGCPGLWMTDTFLNFLCNHCIYMFFYETTRSKYNVINILLPSFKFVYFRWHFQILICKYCIDFNEHFQKVFIKWQ